MHAPVHVQSIVQLPVQMAVPAVVSRRAVMTVPPVVMMVVLITVRLLVRLPVSLLVRQSLINYSVVDTGKKTYFKLSFP